MARGKCFLFDVYMIIFSHILTNQRWLLLKKRPWDISKLFLTTVQWMSINRPVHKLIDLIHRKCNVKALQPCFCKVLDLALGPIQIHCIILLPPWLAFLYTINCVSSNKIPYNLIMEPDAWTSKFTSFTQSAYWV